MSAAPPDNQPNPEIDIAQHSALFWIVTGVLLLVGVVGLLSGLVSLANLFSEGFSWLGIGDTISNLTFSVLMITASRWMMKGRLAAIWLFSAAILITLIYNLIAGRGANVTLAAVGVVGAILILVMEKNGELS